MLGYLPKPRATEKVQRVAEVDHRVAWRHDFPNPSNEKKDKRLQKKQQKSCRKASGLDPLAWGVKLQSQRDGGSDQGIGHNTK